jgi:L-asparaginase
MRRVEMNGPSNLTFSPAGRHPQLCNRETLRLPCSCVELIHLAERLATPFTAHDVVELPRVDVVLSYPGADAALIHAAVTAGAKGIVTAGTGSGRPTAEQEEALDEAVRRGIVACHASRVGAGSVMVSTGRAARRIVAADDPQPWKARILLMLAMTATTDVDEIQQMFDHS